MPQLGLITKNIQLCTGGLWEEKGKIKSLGKKKKVREEMICMETDEEDPVRPV